MSCHSAFQVILTGFFSYIYKIKHIALAFKIVHNEKNSIITFTVFSGKLHDSCKEQHPVLNQTDEKTSDGRTEPTG